MKRYFAGFLLFFLTLSTDPATIQAEESMQLRSQLHSLEHQFTYEQHQYKQLQNQMHTLSVSNRQPPQSKKSGQQKNYSQTSTDNLKSLGTLQGQQEMKLRALSKQMHNIRQQLHMANRPAQQ